MRKLDFQTKILLISFAVTVVLALIIIPILKRLKVGQIEREDGPELRPGDYQHEEAQSRRYDL